jgi:hypothetical protein
LTTAVRPFTPKLMNKILLRCLVLLLLLCSLASCVYLRLLEVKNQLAHFDENFRVDVGDHFTLRFLHPVLLSDDFLELAKLQPTRIEPLPDGQRWYQEFHKINAAGQRQPGVDIVFTLTFNKESKLISWDFSPVFVAMVPPQFFEASLRSLGKGKVDERKKRLRVDPADLPKLAVNAPTRKKILDVMGLPVEQSLAGQTKLYVYHFQVETPHLDEAYEDRRIAVIKLHFNPTTDELVKMGGKFVGLKIAIDFMKLGEKRQVALP